MIRILFFVFTLFFFLACSEKTQKKSTIKTLEVIQNSTDSTIQKILSNSKDHHLQIQLTRIIRKNENDIRFEKESLFLNDSNYFYPASTVKLPIAIFALEKCKQINISSKTPFYIEGDSTLTTIRDEITKIFAISDNEAYNRLYEFLGRNAINASLKKHQLIPAQINHRLSVEDPSDRNTKPYIFQFGDTLMISKPKIDQKLDTLNLHHLTFGKAYMDDEEMILEPFDFSEKNFFPIRVQQQLLKQLFYPKTSKSVFDMTDEDLSFIKKVMAFTPRDINLNAEEYPDGYNKFLAYGSTFDTIPSYLKIYNKIGMAYGFLTDNAYFEDKKNDIAFFLTATLYVNQNETLNDNQYEYDTIGLPFLTQLGQLVYDAELKRKDN